MQSWSHILTKLMAVFKLEGSVTTENGSGKKLTVKYESTPQKGSGKGGKVCGCREEGELSSSSATNYWTNYLPVKILLTQLQEWENTSGGGREPEESEFYHWHEGGSLSIVWSSLLAQSRVSYRQVKAWKHCSLSGQSVPVFDCPLNKTFSCGISCISVWPLVLLGAPLRKPWLPLCPPSHKVFAYIDGILQSLLQTK